MRRSRKPQQQAGESGHGDLLIDTENNRLGRGSI
jgi:hypothetical protein